MADNDARLAAAWALLQQEKYADALAAAEALLVASPGNVAATAVRAMARGMSGKNLAGALDEMERVIAAAPRTGALRYNYALLLGRAGRVAEAAQQYRAALELDPADVHSFWGYSENHRMSDEAELAEAMAGRFDSLPPGLPKELLAFGLAKAFDDLNQPARAIKFAAAAKALTGRRWNPAGSRAQIEALRAEIDAGEFGARRTSGYPSQLPLFIVGMPRSGTTLVETILSRHTDVLALGESRQIGDALEASEHQPAEVRRLTLDASRDWMKARSEMMARGWRSAAIPQPALVTDKMPDNAFALGAIAQLFPRARVVYVRRHPLDNGVSNFFTRFASGQSYTSRLDWIGLRARQLADVMDIWKRSLDLPILDVHYEQLVLDPHTQIRRLVDFAGLTWTDDFLTPEQAARGALTASQWQVKQPIYTTSVARWRRYEPWLGPMIEAMGGMDWIEAQAQT